MSDAWDGRPQNPERAGPHAMQHIATGNIEVKLWTTHARHGDQWCWIDECGDDISSDTVAKYWSYIGPCLTPSEVAAREAAAALAMREAAEAKCEDLRAFGDGAPKSESGNAVAWARAAESLRDQIAAIPVPHADALDALLAKAREEGKREAAKRMHYAEAVIAALCDPWGGMEKVSNEVRDAVRAWRALLTGGGDAQ